MLFCSSINLDSIKNTNYGVARTFGNIFRFIDDLIKINDGSKFENHYHEIYPTEVILKKENTSHTLDLHLCINEGQIQTSLYDKRNYYNLNIVRFPYKCTTIPSKKFFATSSQKYFVSLNQLVVVQFVKTSTVFPHQMLRQGADPLGGKKVLVKMVNRHILQYEKYSTSNRYLIYQILKYLFDVVFA